MSPHRFASVLQYTAAVYSFPHRFTSNLLSHTHVPWTAVIQHLKKETQLATQWLSSVLDVLCILAFYLRRIAVPLFQNCTVTSPSWQLSCLNFQNTKLSLPLTNMNFLLFKPRITFLFDITFRALQKKANLNSSAKSCSWDPKLILLSEAFLTLLKHLTPFLIHFFSNLFLILYLDASISFYQPPPPSLGHNPIAYMLFQKHIIKHYITKYSFSSVDFYDPFGYSHNLVPNLPCLFRDICFFVNLRLLEFGCHSMGSNFRSERAITENCKTSLL